MGERTEIAWADGTYNPWRGCTKITPACDNCYAEKLVCGRLGGAWGPGAPRQRAAATTLNDPMRWERKAIAEGTRPFIFTLSLGDIFDAEVEIDWLRQAFDMAIATPHLVHLWLTKRPHLILRRGGEALAGRPFPPNIALGTTVEDTKRLRNLDHLLQAAAHLGRAGTPPAFTFGSFEPLLEQIEITAYMRPYVNPGLDWVITGFESGPHARPGRAAWARRLRDQAKGASVPFLFKQWGEHLPEGQIDSTGFQWAPGAEDPRVHWWQDVPPDDPVPDDACSVRIGKKLAGNRLDGALHLERPRVPPVGQYAKAA